MMADTNESAPVAVTVNAGSANSHVFDDQIIVDGECIAFASEPWTGRIATALESNRLASAPAGDGVEAGIPVPPIESACGEIGHCCCCSIGGACCDCGAIMQPDWLNASACIENAQIAYDDSTEDEDETPVDTVVSSGDLGVLIGLAKYALALQPAAQGDAAGQKKPDYEAAYKELSDHLSWIHGNKNIGAYWGFNIAAIATDLIRRAYPSIGVPGEPLDVKRVPPVGQ